MTLHLRSLATAGLLLGLVGVSAPAQEKREPAKTEQARDEQTVENPYFKFWRGFKVGSTAVHQETTKLGNPESRLWARDGVDEKRIACKLVEVNDQHVVVEMVVTEREFFGFVQAAPTRYIYPAKVRKQDLERFFLETGAKTGEDSMKVHDKEMKVKTVEGTVKSPAGQETEYKLWLSDEVPGRIVKKTRTTRQKGEVVAETTITLETCKKAE
jgi:hypothetical protein